MRVRDLINKDLINLNLYAESKKDVLCELARIAHINQRLFSKEIYYKKLVEREVQISTGVGYGIAIPHAKTDAVKIPTIMILRLSNCIEWESLDDEPVTLVIGLAVPEKNGGNMHLKIISELSMKLMDDDFRKRLKKAKNEDEVLELMNLVSADKVGK